VSDVVFDPVGHTYHLDGVAYPSVTTIMQEVGVIDTTFYNEAGAERGTAVHDAVSAMVRGDLDMKDMSQHPQIEEVGGYLEAFNWFQIENSIVPIEVEQVFVSREYKYAGTVDLAAEMDGEKYLIDWKTGGHQRWHGLQLAAYAIGTERPNDEWKRAVVLLKKDGNYSILTEHRSIFPFTDLYWDKTWLGIRRAHAFMQGDFTIL